MSSTTVIVPVKTVYTLSGLPFKNIGLPSDSGFLQLESVNPVLVTVGAKCGSPAALVVVVPPVPPFAFHVTLYWPAGTGAGVVVVVVVGAAVVVVVVGAAVVVVVVGSGVPPSDVLGIAVH